MHDALLAGCHSHPFAAGRVEQDAFNKECEAERLARAQTAGYWRTRPRNFYQGINLWVGDRSNHAPLDSAPLEFLLRWVEAREGPLFRKLPKWAGKMSKADNARQMLRKDMYWSFPDDSLWGAKEFEPPRYLADGETMEGGSPCLKTLPSPCTA